MDFFVYSRKHPHPQMTYPCLALYADGWDDYHYQTLFTVRYCSDRLKRVSVGQVKILAANHLETDEVLHGHFTQLGAAFWSVGQNLEYYQKLLELFPDTFPEILTALRDVVYNPALDLEAQQQPGYGTSLFRFSEVYSGMMEARGLFNRHPQKELATRFEFSSKLEEAGEPHRIFMDFDDDGSSLNRIMAFVGPNGTGKTQMLVRLANSLSGWKIEQGDFVPARPSFSKVITVSYSIFDDFDKPGQEEKTFSYVYCGVRPGNQLLSMDEITLRIREAGGGIRRLFRERFLEDVLLELFQESGVDPTDAVFSKNEKYLKRLSSGQKIMLFVVVELVSTLVKNSLIVFDEPENHLHPPTLSAFIRSIHRILEEYDSYAVLATHSPIILQEIPARRVRVFQRVGDVPVVKPLEMESFGENFNTIADHVFGLPASAANFRSKLKELAEKHPIDAIQQFFPYGLPLGTQVYLKLLVKQRD